MEHQRYTLQQDHRHYKKGQSVPLREHVARKLAADGIIQLPGDKPAAASRQKPAADPEKK